MDDQSPLVARIKEQVLAEGVDITTPCGGFEIVKRVAWELRGQGAGVLAKLAGSHPDGDNVDMPYGCWKDNALYAYDVVIFPNGEHYDCLTGYDEKKKTGLDPIWRLVTKEGTSEPYLRPDTYRPAIEPHPTVVEPPAPPQPPTDPTVTPPNTPTVPSVDLSQLVAVQRERLDVEQERLEVEQQILAAIKSIPAAFARALLKKGK